MQLEPVELSMQSESHAVENVMKKRQENMIKNNFNSQPFVGIFKKKQHYELEWSNVHGSTPDNLFMLKVEVLMNIGFFAI